MTYRKLRLSSTIANKRISRNAKLHQKHSCQHAPSARELGERHGTNVRHNINELLSVKGDLLFYFRNNFCKIETDWRMGVLCAITQKYVINLQEFINIVANIRAMPFSHHTGCGRHVDMNVFGACSPGLTDDTSCYAALAFTSCGCLRRQIK